MHAGLSQRALSFLMAAALLCSASVVKAAEAHVRERSESVYVDLNADGTPKSVISSVYLVNSDGAAELSDDTTLTDIKNVLGKEKPQIDGQHIVFQADGDDVCYQGTASGELPVSVEISYTLDGKAISAEQLAGKSGSVGIHIKTLNHSANKRTVNGEELTLYTPFSVICVLTLNDGFSMLQCEHGRVSSQAGSTSVMSILHPGLKDGLGLEDSDNIHDDMSLSAQAKDFSLDSMMFVVMTGLVDEENLSAIDDVQELLDGIDEMADATDELYDGAVELDDGAAEYMDGMKEYLDGMQEYRDGLEKFNGGATEYFFGVKELGNGAAELTSGAQKLNSGIKEMESGIKTVIADSSGALQFAGAIVTMLQAYGVVVDPAVITPAIAAYYTNASKLQLSQLLTGLSKLENGSEQLALGLVQFSGGTTKLSNAGLELLEGAGELRDGFIDLQEGAQELSDGAEDFHEGTGEFKDGLEEFRDEGVKEMQEQTSDISVAISRKGDILALSDEYTTYSGTDKTMKCSVQFIMTTEEIVSAKPIPTESAKPQDIEVVQETDKDVSWLSQLWNTVKSWFSK